MNQKARPDTSYDFSDDPQVVGMPSYNAVPGILLASLATAFVIGVYGKIIPATPALTESSQASKPALSAKQAANAPKTKPGTLLIKKGASKPRLP